MTLQLRDEVYNEAYIQEKQHSAAQRQVQKELLAEIRLAQPTKAPIVARLWQFLKHFWHKETGQDASRPEEREKAYA